MRLAVFGFLCGIFWLQQQAALPEIGWWPFPLLAFVALLPFWVLGQPRTSMVRGACLVAIALSCLALGVAWASWRAGVRMSQELPREWEARDVELIGVIASLPRINDQGARFEFDVEQILTEDAVIPSHLSLAWYTEVNRKIATSTLPPTLTPVSAGESLSDCAVPTARSIRTVSILKRGRWKEIFARLATSAREGKTRIPAKFPAR